MSRKRQDRKVSRYAILIKQTTLALLLATVLGFLPSTPVLSAPPDNANAQTPKPSSDDEKLAQALDQIERTLQRIQSKMDRKQAIVEEKTNLKGLHQAIISLDQKAMIGFKKIEQNIKDKDLPAVIMDRHQKAVAHYTQTMATLQSNLDVMDKAKDDTGFKQGLTNALGHLKEAKKKEKHAPQKFDGGNLPSRPAKPNRSNRPKINKAQFIEEGLYDQSIVRLASHGSFDLGGLVGADNPAYLSETPEIRITESIVQWAALLEHNPVKIYEFVTNKIQWLPAWGSYQSAEQTLINRRGGSIDIAGLLIALLRASGIPARYVHGTVDVDADKLMNWLGGFSNTFAAWDFASAAGLPIVGVASGGNIVRYRLEHVWVEAAIDFNPSRGAINKRADTWVAMDPSFKDLNIVSGSNITNDVAFDVSQYLSTLNVYGPVLDYHVRVTDFIQGQNLEGVPDPLQYKVYITPKEIGIRILPSSLKYKVVLTPNRYAQIPAQLRSIVAINFIDELGNSSANVTFSHADLVGNRVTLSYQPATAQDEALVASYGGSIYDVPPYLLYLTPTLKVNGATVFQGPSLQMGERQKILFRTVGPTITTQGLPHDVIAGSYMGIVINANGIGAGGPGQNNARLWDSVTNKSEPDVSYDELVGEYLHAIAQNYFFATDRRSGSLGGFYNVMFMRMPSEGAALLTPVISYFFGIPRSARPTQVQLDVPGEFFNAMARDRNDQNLKTYLEIRGLEGSYNEGDVFNQISGFSSVSAVKAIQYANQQGIPVHKINQSNFGTVFPLLQLDSEDLNEIRNGINAGYEAIVPEREMLIGSWRGVGFIIRDPQTFSGVYRISGGLSGSNSEGNQVDIEELAKKPHSFFTRSMDAYTQGNISHAALAQIGEVIVDGAMDIHGISYRDTGECSGLVRIAYLAAGICLDPWNPTRCKNPLIKDSDYNKDNPSGVWHHHALANKQGLLESVRRKNNPLLGDIVFFDKTTRPGKELEHEGIITSKPIPGGDGTVAFIHASLSRGVFIGRMNINDPTNPGSNLWIAQSVCLQDDGKCRSGQLFAGYGTIRNGK